MGSLDKLTWMLQRCLQQRQAQLTDTRTGSYCFTYISCSWASPRCKPGYLQQWFSTLILGKGQLDSIPETMIQLFWSGALTWYSFISFKSILLRHNLNTIKCIHFEYVRWHILTSAHGHNEECRTFPQPPVPLYSFAVDPIPTLAPRPSLIYFLSLYIRAIFYKISYNWNHTECVRNVWLLFINRMFCEFIGIIVSNSISFLSIAK